MNIMWKKIADVLDKEGSHVNWKEHFFVCPCSVWPIVRCNYWIFIF